MKLYLGDCFDIFTTIQDHSIDFILRDPPYGTTHLKWDSIIPFDKLWSELNRVIKKDRAIALFGIEPFSSKLRLSNLEKYKYDWVWYKNKPANICCANKCPMRYHENISVFNAKHHYYYPQKVSRSEGGIKRLNSITEKSRFKVIKPGSLNSSNKKFIKDLCKYDVNLVYPKSILEFKKQEHCIHPTQKPVPLLEYLIKTYTVENEIVLDFTMGVGSTGIACLNTNRHFIGIEKDENYFNLAKERIKNNNENKTKIVKKKRCIKKDTRQLEFKIYGPTLP